ncbi:MAG: chemotaxis protein CheA [Deltaproteobacteria bacterium]|nr:chemotaxis protein CheA [Deltaproteobacteria bacterium]
MDMSKYKGMFISETKEHLQSMNKLIISLEKTPDKQEDIEALFREAHSVKGMAASMGYSDISELSHKMEDMMDLFRKGTLKLDSSAVDLLFEGLDSLELMLKGIENDEPAGIDCSALISKMQDIQKVKGSGREAEAPREETAETPLEPKATEGALLTVDIKIDSSSQIPGMRGFLVYKNLTNIAEVVSVAPDIETVKQGDFGNEISFRISTEKGAAQVNEMLKKMVDLASFSVYKVDTVTASAEESSKRPAQEPPGFSKPGAPPKKQQVRTVRVTTDLLDNLINIVGEMIIARSRLFEMGKEIPSEPLHEGMLEMSKLIRDLHGQVMSVRMTPIENLMERLPRVVRDLARKSDKEVELAIEGKDIELDRAIVDEMGDPLVHILRNCVDHGVESMEDRKAAGKNPVGIIKIRAMREKDQVYINIQDDGRGMDVDKIKRKAIARGILKKEKLNLISDKEALMLVCHSGLSTAEKVTDVSGRGVGMDAVKSVVDSIGGSLHIDSTPNKGTIITLKLPLTVAIVHVLLVKVNEEVLAIPINKIIRTAEVEKSGLKRSQKQLAVLIDNELIPLLSLKRILKMKGKDVLGQQISIVVVEMKNKKIGLVVDSFVEQQESFVKPLEPPLSWVKGFSGATILGDGSVIFVLDMPNLL